MYQTNKASLYRGRPHDLVVTLVDSAGEQFHTCGFTGTMIRLEKQDGSFLEKTPSGGFQFGVLNPTFMQVFSLTAEETALLKLGPEQSVFLKIIFGANSAKYQLKRFLEVSEDIF